MNIKRTINAHTLEYYLIKIEKDFSEHQLAKAIFSIEGHIAYYEARRKVNRPTERSIVDKFKARLNTTPATSDYPDEVQEFSEGQTKQVVVNV